MAQASCDKQAAGAFGVDVWKVGNGVGFKASGLAVDADGAPNSYRVDGKGLSFTCDGVFGIENGVPVTQKSDPSRWLKVCQDAWAKAQLTKDYSNVKIVGFEMDANGPVVQKDGDPLPGEAYITTTSMTVPGTPANTQRHYVNAAEIPYLVLPTNLTRTFNMAFGDVAVVFRPKTGAMASAIYADCCDAGEASVKLHQDLQSNPIVVKDGVERAEAGISDRIITVLFPGQHPQPSTDVSAWRQSIQDVGRAAFDAWGGPEKLRACQ
jgi:Fungal chitosanase of glycosyl hydrolase group 75